ncbi:MAG: hypothetical protein ABFS56_04325 [Pseudomonadota bacterium]
MLKKLALFLSLFGLTSAAIASGGEFDCSTVTDVPYEECEALVAFYNSTNGDNWYINDGWLETNNVCDWLGVECEGLNVSRRVLIRNGLTGSIPPELGKLSGLMDLQMSDNQLTGSIPTELGKLSGLMRLNLSGNQLTGSIPTELSDLSYLKMLFLDSNQLGES